MLEKEGGGRMNASELERTERNVSLNTPRSLAKVSAFTSHGESIIVRIIHAYVDGPQRSRTMMLPDDTRISENLSANDSPENRMEKSTAWTFLPRVPRQSIVFTTP